MKLIKSQIECIQKNNDDQIIEKMTSFIYI